MDENLVGYLLDALEPDDYRQVEAHLRVNPEAQRRLETLRRLLRPLESDRAVEPPPGLADRTLALCRGGAPPATLPLSNGLPRAPRLRIGQALGHSMAWFRSGDALVAASIILVFLGIGLPILDRVARQHQVLACQDNLRTLHTALVSYSDQHGGEFPRVEAHPPRNVAGIFVPVLKDAGVLSPQASVACPGSGKTKSAECCTVGELEAMHREQPEKFRDAVRDLSCCYAYSLGYGSGPVHHGLRHDGVSDSLPILADRPGYVGNQVKPGSSPNHSHGQNVLHVGGHVKFCTTRGVGPNGDDIFVNRDRKVAAGHDQEDAVLGASWTRPYPHPNE